jgi:LuxR family maltose regulon positive regulatory protein
VVEARILIARHYFLIGRTADSIRAFLEAVKLAAPEKMLRPFVEDGEAIVPIVRNLIRSLGISAIDPQRLAFIMEILSTLSPVPFGRGSASAVFTQKELDVLSLLLDNHPNKLIARRLKISEATVKFHLINIYRKLGVGGRSDAKALARERRLVISSTP